MNSSLFSNTGVKRIIHLVWMKNGNPWFDIKFSTVFFIPKKKTPGSLEIMLLWIATAVVFERAMKEMQMLKTR